ncbi:MAG: hypothetical protein P8019_17210 [Gammaproteobacteria bacterium]
MKPTTSWMVRVLLSCILISPSIVLAADDAVIQSIQTNVTTANGKADQNASDIANLKGGLPELQRQINDLQTRINDLQNQINNIELIPGPVGPEGPRGIDAPDRSADICALYITMQPLGGPAPPSYCSESGGGILNGFGNIIGTANNITAAVIDSASPSIFRNIIDFGTNPYDPTDLAQLSPGAQQIVAEDSSGGSGILAEAFAFDILFRTDNATLLKSSSEIYYIDPAGKKTDLIVEIDSRKAGVSVTRAVPIPASEPYTYQQAQDLLTKKLNDILSSTANVEPVDLWDKQILYVLADSTSTADMIEAAWDIIDPAIKADTIMVLTVTEGDDVFLYQ